jgi:hypothetical protein
MRHWHREPAPSTECFIEAAAVQRTGRGVQIAVEVIVYPDGKVQVAVSKITGRPGQRTIHQTDSLMFNDINEAKDAVDGLLDRADREAGIAPSVVAAPEEAAAIDFSAGGLRAAAFDGFERFGDLLSGGLARVPAAPGVYVVVREAMTEPLFLDRSCGGISKVRIRPSCQRFSRQSGLTAAASSTSAKPTLFRGGSASTRGSALGTRLGTGVAATSGSSQTPPIFELRGVKLARGRQHARLRLSL